MHLPEGSEGKEADVLTHELILFKRAFLNRYKPTADCQRPLVRKGLDLPNRIVVQHQVEEQMACMLAGHKYIFWGGTGDVSLISSKLKAVLQAAGFRCLYGLPEARALYGRQQAQVVIYMHDKVHTAHALLLMRYAIEHIAAAKSFADYNHYVVGHLLGYPHDDIKYFYATKLPNRDFVQDTRWAKLWILLSFDDVGQWIQDHRAKYDIKHCW